MKEITKEYLEQEYVQNKKSANLIALDRECSAKTIYTKLKEFGIPQEDRTRTLKPGLKFKKLTIIEICGSYKNGTLLWMCKCECGEFVKRTTPQLKSGERGQCLKCYKKNTRIIKDSGKFESPWRGIGDISGNFISGIRCGAKHRNIKFDLKSQDLWDLFEKQEKKCFYSGLDLHFDTHKEISSLDRIDSSDHYHIDNVVWCHKDINKIKASFSVDEFLSWCEKITNFEPNFIFKDIKIEIHSSYYKDLEHNAKKRKLELGITKEEIIQVFCEQGGICALSGVGLVFPDSCSFYRQRLHTASVDRIDNNLNYSKNNIQIVHKKLNQSRKDLTIEYYKELCQIVYNRTKIM